MPPEWHAWLHYTTDAPIVETQRRPWQKPHLPNPTGTPLSYRPPGHDYEGGQRARATGDYEALDAGQHDMGRHGVAETVTGACVLLVAIAFLAFAVAHSGRTSGSGLSA